MKDFRSALEGYLSGQLEPAAAQAQITAAVTRSPQLAPAMLATIEAYVRSGRATPELAASLGAVVNATAAAARAAPPPPSAPPPPAATPPAAPPAPATDASPASDKTQFRPAAGAPPATPPPQAGSAPASASAAGGDKTQFRPAGGGLAAAAPAPPAATPAPGDHTHFRPLAAGANQQRPADSTHAPATSTSVSEMRRSATGTGTGTGTGMGTSAGSWTDFGQAGSTQGEQLTLGSVLAGRYVLDSIVAGGDRGGMGVVYKAMDLRQQEAQERNPYVAIKVLNEDFKRHPDSIKALVKETNKTRKLAHPNIINVHTFDRDKGNVFMAMELLEGSPLNELIRANRDRGGLPVGEAMKIIRGLSDALAHAHANRIVHSDFKPGNAFLTDDGRVKVLDFGIARAAKAGGAGDGDRTTFDAGTLGALTMPYASCEQIEGQEPDTSDDVYALGVVAYELLTGRHPFERTLADPPGKIEKTDAVKARDLKLKPARPKNLGSTQWKALQRAMAFSRDKRLNNASEFITALTPRKKPVGVMVSVGVAVVLIGTMAALLLPSYIEDSRVASMARELQEATDDQVIGGALQRLATFREESRNSVLYTGEVMDRLFRYYETRARGQFDPVAGHYNYAAALATLDEATKLGKAVEGSNKFAEFRRLIEAEGGEEIPRQTERFKTQLQQRVLIPQQGKDNVQSTLQVIAQLDPKHALLKDPRLPGAFAEGASAALEAKDDTLAQALLAAGLQHDPKYPALLDVQDRFARQRAAADLNTQVADMERNLGSLGAAGARLEDFRAQREALAALRRAKPESATLVSARTRLEQLVNTAVSAGLATAGGAPAQQQIDAAQALLGEFAEQLGDGFLKSQQSAIARVVGDARARDSAIQQLRTELAQHTRTPAADEAWVRKFERIVGNLESQVGKGDSGIREARASAGLYLLSQASQFRTAQRFDQAEQILALATRIGAGPEQVTVEKNALAQARARQDEDKRALNAKAALEDAKSSVLDQARAGRIEVAETQLATLRKTLPANDPFLTDTAPGALAAAHLVRAERSASQARFDEAIREADAARTAAPRLASATAIAGQLRAAQTLATRLGSASDLAPLQQELDRVRGLGRDSMAAVEQGLTSVVAARITKLGSTDPAGAMQLRAGALKLFPTGQFRSFTVTRTPPPAAPAQPVSPGTAPPPAPAGPGAGAATQAEVARNVAGPAAPASVTTPQVDTPATAVTTSPVTTTPAPATPRPVVAGTGKPCEANLAGKGQLGTRAGCRDGLSSGGTGPELVVIAAGDGGEMFAIARNETSVGEYDAYCAATGCAVSAGGTAEIPMTGASAAAAEKYSAWLSSVTGQKYRLPTEAEWRRAAGTAPDPKANCVVQNNGVVTRGTSLRPANQGDLNALGLRHAVGNVQEWAGSASAGWKAMGGAVGDPIASCLPSLARAHNGAPDGKTGFRLVREMR